MVTFESEHGVIEIQSSLLDKVMISFGPFSGDDGDLVYDSDSDSDSDWDSEDEDEPDESVYDKDYGIWIHDRHGDRRFFSNTLIPPCCEWNRVCNDLDYWFDMTPEGGYILVGQEGIYVHARSAHYEVSWAIRREGEEGWSCHAFYGHESDHYVTMADARFFKKKIEAIRPMGPLAPRRYETPFQKHSNVPGVLVHDPFERISMRQIKDLNGHPPLPLATEAFWSKAQKTVETAMMLYHSPKVGEQVLIREVLDYHLTEEPYTVRYQLMLTENGWTPCMTIQPRGEEFIGYDYEWAADISPVDPSPSF